MRRLRLYSLIVFAAILTTALSTTAAQPPTTEVLIADLRGGGYVLYWRHTVTDRSQSDTDIASCETQRNLNAQGIADAAAIGGVVRRLQIPIGTVYSTGFCRTQDTARLGFGAYETANDMLTLDGVKARISTAPAAGTNTVLVAHGGQMFDLVGILIDEGEMMVVQPTPDGSYRIVDTIKPADWLSLVPQTPSELAAVAHRARAVD